MSPTHVAEEGAAAAEPGLCDLPDELLLRVLEQLPMAFRHTSVALVNRRLHALCLAPQLLHDMEFNINEIFHDGDEEDHYLVRLESLLRFLQRHAAHVRSLDLMAFAVGNATEHIMAACLGVCGTMPQLQSLTLHAAYEWGRLSWLGGATALSSLQLVDAGATTDVALVHFSRLTALRELHLSGGLVCPAPATKPCLPPSLTWLCIEGDVDNRDNARDLPPQLLLGLTGLQRLTLLYTDYSSDSLAPVSALTALTSLRLEEAWDFPPPSSLSVLSNLCQLEVVNTVPSMDDVEAAVAALPGLTALALHLGPYDDEVLRLPLSITALRRLRRLSFSTYGDGTLDAGFPGGPWLAQLRWLGLPWQMAVRAAATLATTTQLQHLCLFVLPPCDLLSNQGVAPEQWATFWRAMQAHESLRRFMFEVQSDNAAVPATFVDGLLELQRRPELHVARLEHDHPAENPGSQFWEEMLGAAAEPAA